jgi:hypothetical protein
MKAFFAVLLSVIAVGVLLIAYGLLAPRASAAPENLSMMFDPQTGTYQMARPVYAGQRIALPDSSFGYQPAPGRFVSTPVGYSPAVYSTAADYPAYEAPAPAVRQAPIARTVRPARVSQRSAASVERAPGRNWKKTALVIGGSTATGAGLGALIGGKKGALIGAAIGGGAGTIYEVRK